MTRVYFVRHAQPKEEWKEDRTRPLTDLGKTDTEAVLRVLKEKKIEVFYCSPYKRSMDTIAGTAEYFGCDIITNERLREREAGINGSTPELIEKRWANFDFHEDGGESLRMLQERNIAAFLDILRKHENKNIVVGTHGAALSSILHFYDPGFGFDDFMRFLHWKPYVIELDFEGEKLVARHEHLYLERE